MKQNNNKTIHIIFFGTHIFASHILKALVNSPNFSVDLVITKPDKPIGRKQILHSPPVKLFAKQHKIFVEQPQKLKNYTIKKNTFDLGVTVQYGLLIPQHILDAPTHGIMNIHTSLLPKYRGATPIQSAILNGETESGVTFMLMDAGLDTGPILQQEKIIIDPDEKTQELEEKLANISAKNIEFVIHNYLSGLLQPQKQNDTKATTCSQLSRKDGHIDFSKNTNTVYNQYRALTPWPGIWTTWNGARLKLLEIKPSNKKIPAGEVQMKDKKLLIGTADGSIEIIQIQKEGKQAIDAQSFLNGNKTILGTKMI